MQLSSFSVSQNGGFNSRQRQGIPSRAGRWDQVKLEIGKSGETKKKRKSDIEVTTTVSNIGHCRSSGQYQWCLNKLYFVIKSNVFAQIESDCIQIKSNYFFNFQHDLIWSDFDMNLNKKNLRVQRKKMKISRNRTLEGIVRSLWLYCCLLTVLLKIGNFPDGQFSFLTANAVSHSIESNRFFFWIILKSNWKDSTTARSNFRSKLIRFDSRGQYLSRSVTFLGCSVIFEHKFTGVYCTLNGIAWTWPALYSLHAGRACIAFKK
jgi:hypothetical protein